MNVFAIRHGETAWSLSGQHTGTTDIPLTDNGRRLAERLRPVLAKEAFALVLSSPMQRARETCELAGLGDRAVIDPDLAEWNYGQYEGLTTKQIYEGATGWLIFQDGCPGGETPDEVGARIDRVIARARATLGDVIDRSDRGIQRQVIIHHAGELFADFALQENRRRGGHRKEQKKAKRQCHDLAA